MWTLRVDKGRKRKGGPWVALLRHCPDDIRMGEATKRFPPVRMSAVYVSGGLE
jgi:hypothetical protein